MGTSGKRTKTHHAGLTRDKVLLAAVRMADKNGLESLSMRKLAQGLGVEAMSLYNHVKNKEDVLDGMVELVAAKIDLPSSDENWKLSLRARAISAHAVLMSHPWAAMLFVSRINTGPAMLRQIDATLGCLRSAGFSYALADRAWNAVDNHIYGFTLQALNFPFEESAFAEVAAQYLPLIPEKQYPFLHGLSKVVISGEHDGIQDFCFGLDLILDGLDKNLDGDREVK